VIVNEIEFEEHLLPCCGGIARHLPVCRWFGTDRGTGKTTRLMEDAINALAEGYEVVVTGAHPIAVRELEHQFRCAGLVGVHFMSPHQIRDGKLRGLKPARMLVDDIWDLDPKMRDVIERERMMLHAYG